MYPASSNTFRRKVRMAESSSMTKMDAMVHLSVHMGGRDVDVQDATGGAVSFLQDDGAKILFQ